MDGIVRPAHLRITGRTASDLAEQKIPEFQSRPANRHLLPQLTSRIALADSLGRIHTKPRPAHLQNSHNAGARSPFMRTLSELPGAPVLTVGTPPRISHPRGNRRCQSELKRVPSQLYPSEHSPNRLTMQPAVQRQSRRSETVMFGDVTVMQLPKLSSSRRLAMSYPPRNKTYGGTGKFGDTGHAMSNFHSMHASFVDQVTPRSERKSWMSKVMDEHFPRKLPPGWAECFDKQTKRPYWHHEASNFSQWNDPSCLDKVAPDAHQLPFQSNMSELLRAASRAGGGRTPINRNTYLQAVSQLNLSAPRKKQPVNKETRKEAIRILSCWSKRREKFKYLLSWHENEQRHRRTGGCLRAALTAAKNLSTLRKFVYAWAHFTLAKTVRDFKQSYRKWKHRYARVKIGAVCTMKPLTATRRLALIVAKHGFDPGARSINQARFEQKITVSREEVVPGVPLAEFGTWLVAHDYYNWRRLKRGRRGEEKEYDMSDLERAADGWFKYRQEARRVKRTIAKRMDLSKNPAGWWPRLALVLSRGYWTTAKAWWQEKRLLEPGISKRIRFSGAGLMRALWVCTEAGSATAVLAQMVNQVSLAAAVSQYKGELYKCKRRK